MSRCPEMGLPLDNDMQESNMKKTTLSPPQRFGAAPLALCAALVAQGFTLAAMASGTVIYCAAMALGIKPLGLHPISVGITASLVLFLAGSYVGRRSERT